MAKFLGTDAKETPGRSRLVGLLMPVNRGPAQSPDISRAVR